MTSSVQPETRAEPEGTAAGHAAHDGDRGGDRVVVQPRAAERLTSLDAFRGFVMFLMMAEVLRISQVARAFPESGFWQLLRFNTTHVEWVGCSLHDLIQPGFSFLVGTALAYSIASRRARGQPVRWIWFHALWRSLLLVLLGVFLRSVGRPETNWTFEDTLSQIGLGYPFLFLLGLCSRRTQWGAFAMILVAYWAAWALYPLPGPGYDYARVGVPPDWSHHASGFAAHWNKNANLGSAFDQWFLNLFPRSEPFVANGGGYLTLSFIPTLATMLLGLLAGGWLRGPGPGSAAFQAALPGSRHAAAALKGARAALPGLALAGGACLALGLLLHALGICPIVKRIWTPSWVLYSGGWCFLLLAGFYAVIDGRGRNGVPARAPFRAAVAAFPLVVIGMNSIAAYVIAHLFVEEFTVSSVKTHFGEGFFQRVGETYAPLFQGAVVLLVYWLILYWLYRRKLFLRI